MQPRRTSLVVVIPIEISLSAFVVKSSTNRYKANSRAFDPFISHSVYYELSQSLRNLCFRHYTDRRVCTLCKLHKLCSYYFIYVLFVHVMFAASKSQKAAKTSEMADLFWRLGKLMNFLLWKEVEHHVILSHEVSSLHRLWFPLAEAKHHTIIQFYSFQAHITRYCSIVLGIASNYAHSQHHQ